MVCPRCNRDLPLGRFRRRHTQQLPDGPDIWCRTCEREHWDERVGTVAMMENLGASQPLSAERAGALNAKDNLPATGDGTQQRDPTDRQPSNHYGRIRALPVYVGGDDDEIDEFLATCDCGWKSEEASSHAIVALLDLVRHLNAALGTNPLAVSLRDVHEDASEVRALLAFAKSARATAAAPDYDEVAIKDALWALVEEVESSRLLVRLGAPEDETP